jgi:oxygen-independent coproporphyrinogen-3 oxidase
LSHVYVHVPFCARRCSYCDFAIAVRRRVPADAYLRAITRELELRRERGGPLATLYFGGGTPSALPPDAFTQLVALITRALPLAADAEVTVEANPEDVTPAAAAAWRGAGVNRVSLGAQSFDERALRWMHRGHDATRVRDAVAILRRADIANVSLDLIFALPVELCRDWADDLERAVALAPEHLSLYGLTVEPRTPLARWIARGAAVAPDDDRYADEYLAAHARLAAAGYAFYEVSNAARPGFRSRHNTAYWTGAPYLGLGPAAHSFDGRSRRWNIAAWERYRSTVGAGRIPVESEEELSEEQRALERRYLALRTAAGLPLGDVAGRERDVARWTAAGWVERRADRLVCRPEGWLRLDALVRALAGDAA